MMAWAMQVKAYSCFQGIPGYPYWLWKVGIMSHHEDVDDDDELIPKFAYQVNYLQSLPMIKAYRENSLKVDSDEMRRIRRAARDNQMY